MIESLWLIPYLIVLTYLVYIAEDWVDSLIAGLEFLIYSLLLRYLLVTYLP